ncbi:MAG TPA: protein-disulfide reductase DsbD domain-containing protein [Luteolibacter sp.]|nr:protein-disulfide reductase DsbD domain-containing protein [Luteolibacter sp.]
MIARIAMLSAIAAGFTYGAEAPNPGRAKAELIAVSATVPPGKPLQTAIRIRHDKGWHSYWLNPGEAGMPTTVEWELPPGWKHGEPGFPAPVRFLTGELAGYGYEGELLLPVTLTPPEDFAGAAKLEAEISWLACSDEGCVPGEAKLSLEVAAGDAATSPAAAEIIAAIDLLPRPAGEALRLAVEETDNSLILTLLPGKSASADLSRHEVFPLTPELIDPKAQIRFTAEGPKWIATVPKSEFAASPVKELTLVLTDRKNPPLQVTWKIE